MILRATLAAVALASLLAFAAFGLDKRAARRGARRTPESTLLLLALLGGPGALAAMRAFRHKTRKPRFALAAWTGAALSVAVIALAWR